MSSAPTGSAAPSIVAIFAARRCASVTPRVRRPTKARSAAPPFFSRISWAMRVRARSSAASSRTCAFSRYFGAGVLIDSPCEPRGARLKERREPTTVTLHAGVDGCQPATPDLGAPAAPCYAVGVASPSRLLLIVPPSDAKLLAYLTRAFAGVEGVEVIPDRRQPGGDTRGGETRDRRSASGAPAVSHLFGYTRVRLPSRATGAARDVDPGAAHTLLWPGLRLDAWPRCPFPAAAS